MTFSMKIAFGAGDVFDGLSRNRIWQKANEIARMPGLKRNADLAVGLEPANAWAVTCAWIDNNKRPQLRIDFDTCGRDHTHKAIVHRSVESTPVENQLDFDSRARSEPSPPCARNTDFRADASRPRTEHFAERRRPCTPLRARTCQKVFRSLSRRKSFLERVTWSTPSCRKDAAVHGPHSSRLIGFNRAPACSQERTLIRRALFFGADCLG